MGTIMSQVSLWCGLHNAELIDYGANGFSYMLDNGTMWYMPYDEIGMQKGANA